MAYHFDGSTGYAIQNSPFSNGVIDNFTISFWIRTTSTTYGCAVGVVETGATAQVVQILINTQNGTTYTANNCMIMVRNAGGTSNQRYYTTTNVADGNWHNIILVRSGSTTTFYYDGTVIAGTAVSSTLLAGAITFARELAIGARNNRGTIDLFFECDMAYVGILNFAASTYDVVYLVGACYPPDIPGCVHAYAFRSSGSGDDNGTFNNDVTFSGTTSHVDALGRVEASVTYVGNSNWNAVTQWASSTAYSVGDLRRQSGTPTVGNERVFRCITAGTSGASQPTWNLAIEAETQDNTVRWMEVTGDPAYGLSAPYRRVHNASARFMSVRTIYVSSAHLESTAGSFTWYGGHNQGCVRNYISTNLSALPAVSSNPGAFISYTGAATLSFVGFAYICSCEISSGTSTSNGVINFTSAFAWWFKFENCTLYLNGNNSSSRINMGVVSATGVDSKLELDGCYLSFTNSGQGITIRCPFEWSFGAIANVGSTVPNSLIRSVTLGNSGSTKLNGLNLINLGGSKSIAEIGGSATCDITVKNTFMSIGPYTSGTILAQGGTRFAYNYTGFSTILYPNGKYAYGGSVETELTIVRARGATVPLTAGSVQYSRKMVSLTTVGLFYPLTSSEIVYYNGNVGSPITLSIPIVTDNLTLNDLQIWLEIEYLGTADSPQATYTHNRCSPVASATNWPVDSISSWTTTGLTTPSQQLLSISITPMVVGPIYLTVALAEPSTTVYFDPKIIDTDIQYIVNGSIINNNTGLVIKRSRKSLMGNN